MPDNAEIESILLFCAALVDDIGPTAQPWLDFVEAEFVARKNKATQVDRIKRLLER